MKQIKLTDITLTESGESLSFKEKVEVAKVLDRLGVDTIRLPMIRNPKPDTMATRTMAAVVSNSTLSMPAGGYTIQSVDEAWNAVCTAKKSELFISIPMSAVGMEYNCGKKPAAVLELITELVSHAKTHTENVNFAAEDATRSETTYLVQAISAAISAGATTITICDSAGNMMPDEISAFIEKLIHEIPALSDIPLEIQCANGISLAAACTVSALRAGASGAAVTVGNASSAPSLSELSQIIRIRGEDIGLRCGIRITEMKRSLRALGLVTGISSVSADKITVPDSRNDIAALSEGDDIETVTAAVKKLGYDLSDEDLAKVYESVVSTAAKKSVGAVELEAIIATVALQVPDTYRLIGFMVTNGSGIASTAYIKMEKNGEILEGVCAGHGPIDAAFLAVDQIIGKKYELDDFQIQSVTEGKEAMGSALVKLRRDGKLYSGNGISTDIIGSSIRAYVNAINKIAYDENI
mgnify:FL=1